MSEEEKTLNVGDILAVLFSSFAIDTFHWAICVPINSKEAAKYHANNAGGKWLFEDPVPLHSIIKSRTISAAVKIGSLEPNVSGKDILRDHLEPVSMSIPVIDQAREPEFNCRVWFRKAVRVLDQAGILQCRDVDALEAECKSYAMGNQIGPNWQGYRYHASSHSF
ncbi:hypothetical protein B0H14DRAFT_3859340 [Mycena olivaceomarginata]|nr:hypothetical protein B0H14DRAFT_2441451 [Mycena olivaceomarginata]KAJ7875864.1 hypothetical protein B0H14DRAFT_3859340 [Mycena olivaceomarginata]